MLNNNAAENTVAYLGMTTSSCLGCCGGERATVGEALLFTATGEASTSGGVAEDC